MKSLQFKLYPFLLCWVLFQTGCASNPGLNGVVVTLTSLRPVPGSSAGSQATMALSLVNENVIPIAISGGSYTLYLNGTSVGKTVSNDAVGLPQQSTASLNVTISLNNAALVKNLQDGNGAKTASYRLEGVLRIEAGDEHLTLKSSASGSVDVTAFR